jgi:hypothetical protein
MVSLINSLEPKNEIEMRAEPPPLTNPILLINNNSILFVATRIIDNIF